jgi:hypothetical protein
MRRPVSGHDATSTFAEVLKPQVVLVTLAQERLEKQASKE